MENITLEKELQARIFVHRTAVLGAFIMREYMDKKRKDNTGVELPDFIIQKQADEFSNRLMSQAMQDGTFNDMYELAWDNLSESIPDNLKVL